MEADFDSDTDFTRPYAELFSQFQHWEDLGSWVNPTRFKSGGYAYFRVSFSAMPEFTTQVLEPRKASNCRLELVFNKATTEALRWVRERRGCGGEVDAGFWL